MNVTAMISQIQDRIPHQLAGAVIGHVATALDFVKLDSQRGKRRFRDAEVRLLPGSSKGDHRRMLDKKQDIPQAFLRPKGCQPSLQGERVGVGHKSEVDQTTSLHCHNSERAN